MPVPPLWGNTTETTVSRLPWEGWGTVKRRLERSMEDEISKRAEEILDNCGLAGEYLDVEDGVFRVHDRRNLLRPLAQEIATMEVDLKRCTHRDTRYFALLKAYEGALSTLKKM